MIEHVCRYIAIGDSFTEGLWDPAPGVEDTQRGWADRLASSLSTRRTQQGLPALEYANHAVRGKLLGDILDDQLPRALDQNPDLVSIVGGGMTFCAPDPIRMCWLAGFATPSSRPAESARGCLLAPAWIRCICR